MLSRWLHQNGELTTQGRKLCWWLVGLYTVAIILMCWTPQMKGPDDVSTPNIIYVGRLVFLLVPFNSFVAFGELDSLKEVIWVIGQNVVNVFLIFPLVLGLLALYPPLRTWKRILVMSLLLSLTIESGQLVLDMLITANRVFEIDDLWTNTLGGVIALGCFNNLQNKLKSLV